MPFSLFISIPWLCTHPCVQIIQRQLEQVEEKQRQLEERGVAVEKALRGEAGNRIPLIHASVILFSSVSQFGRGVCCGLCHIDLYYCLVGRCKSPNFFVYQFPNNEPFRVFWLNLVFVSRWLDETMPHLYVLWVQPFRLSEGNNNNDKIIDDDENESCITSENLSLRYHLDSVEITVCNIHPATPKPIKALRFVGWMSGVFSNVVKPESFSTRDYHRVYLWDQDYVVCLGSGVVHCSTQKHGSVTDSR